MLLPNRTTGSEAETGEYSEDFEGADILEKQFPSLKNLVLVLGDRDTCPVLTLVSSKSGVRGHLSEAGPHARYEE